MRLMLTVFGGWEDKIKHKMVNFNLLHIISVNTDVLPFTLYTSKKVDVYFSYFFRELVLKSFFFFISNKPVKI